MWRQNACKFVNCSPHLQQELSLFVFQSKADNDFFLSFLLVRFGSHKCGRSSAVNPATLDLTVGASSLAKVDQTKAKHHSSVVNPVTTDLVALPPVKSKAKPKKVIPLAEGSFLSTSTLRRSQRTSSSSSKK